MRIEGGLQRYTYGTGEVDAPYGDHGHPLPGGQFGQDFHGEQ